MRAASRGASQWLPTVTGRVVQAALKMVIEPIFESRFAKHSYGFRPGRGCKDALRRVEALLRAGRTHIVDVDNRYFTNLGLYCLLDARKVESASLRSGANH